MSEENVVWAWLQWIALAKCAMKKIKPREESRSSFQEYLSLVEHNDG